MNGIFKWAIDVAESERYLAFNFDRIIEENKGQRRRIISLDLDPSYFIKYEILVF